ncbi:hypothetical protein OG884_04005 [Streptosporangium sp. NBC_01755]|uniref:hypothetical protein n=1 Tax=Streptosporangium sp. NBC_01755 TaxID=2975949 RepID=UPI002DD9779F|nr:hypothetical protein [Streptosporangium sp. NBC_01755]WSD01110.1 hypothetical protein OG884_04005 [Streptosporangium sp. NBC_01755]
MSVVIGEVISEVVLSGGSAAHGADAPGSGPAGDDPDDALVERIVRQATERVLERLRREWEG